MLEMTTGQQEAARRALRLAAPVTVLGAFARALHEAGRLPIGELWLFLEKPWKWADEYLLWRRYGEPASDDPVFESFAAALDAYHEVSR